MTFLDVNPSRCWCVKLAWTPPTLLFSPWDKGKPMGLRVSLCSSKIFIFRVQSVTNPRVKKWPQTRGQREVTLNGMWFPCVSIGFPRPLPLATCCSLLPSLPRPLLAPRGQEPRRRPWRASSPGKTGERWKFIGKIWEKLVIFDGNSRIGCMIFKRQKC